MICTNTGSATRLESFHATGNGKPDLQALTNGHSGADISISDGVMICKFKRTLEVPTGSEGFMISLNASLHHLLAWGSFSSGVIQYHTGRRFFAQSDLQVMPTVSVF